MEKEGKNGLEDSLEGRTTFNRIKGVKVFDADGEPFGHVDDVEINMSTLNPTRLIIHKGLFGEYMRVNLKYIEKVTKDAIHLWISPAKNLVGSEVIDSEGDKVGEVIEGGKGKNGSLEYIKVQTRIIRTKDEDEDQVETYTVPMMSFEDMSVSLPTPIREGDIATRMEMNRENLYIEAEEVIDVGKNCIRLKGKKEKYVE